jgi:hypothetical protein
LHLLAGADDATVEVIFRHRPLSGIRGHETGETAVQLSEIAANRGEFWQFLEKSKLLVQPKVTLPASDFRQDHLMICN